MGLKTVGAAEAPSAHLTLEEPPLLVGPHVGAQLRRLGEDFLTLSTPENNMKKSVMRSRPVFFFRSLKYTTVPGILKAFLALEKIALKFNKSMQNIFANKKICIFTFLGKTPHDG